MEEVKTKSYYTNQWGKVCYFYESFQQWLKNVHGLTMDEYDKLKD